MHHFICQFCHTDCMLKISTLTQSQLARVRNKQHFSQSLPRGELWTVLRLACMLNWSPFSSSSHGYWDMHHFICQFCHTDFMLKLTQSQLARMRNKQHFWSGAQSLPRGELWTVLRLALAHTVTEICTTSFVYHEVEIVKNVVSHAQVDFEF